VLAGLAARRIDLHVGLDRLRDLHGLRIDDLLAVAAWPALPLEVAGAIDPRLAVELVHQVAVGAFERAHEHAMLGLALPDNVGEWIVVAGAGLSGRCGFVFGQGTGPSIVLTRTLGKFAGIVNLPPATGVRFRGVRQFLRSTAAAG